MLYFGGDRGSKLAKNFTGADSAMRRPCRVWWAPALLFAITLALVNAGISHANSTGTNAALRAKYGALLDQLSHNQFQRPLYLVSSETPASVAGDIHARVAFPFAIVGAALNNPTSWCEILILHPNTKYCRASTAGKGSVLNVSIGKKHDQPLADAYRVIFAYRVAVQTPDYLQIRLDADEGPFSTRNYRIVLEAVPVENEQTFIRLSYSYAYGVIGRLALQTYLATVGRDKVGFTVAGAQADGQPLLVRGMRGLVERNTMRYYLAIEAFLGALSAPQQARFEQSLRDWFAATERYAPQLHELEQAEYLDMKGREYRRQRADDGPNTLANQWSTLLTSDPKQGIPR